MKESTDPRVYLFKDLGPHCKDPQIVRLLRDLYFSSDSRFWTMILLDAAGLPPEVRRLTVPFEVGWPSEQELLEIVRSTFQEAKRRSLQQVESKLTKRELELLVQTLQGLTSEEAARVVSGAIHDDNVLDGSDLPRIVDAKRNRLGTMGCLEPIVADVSPEEIGGLKNLKQWLDLRHGGFSRDARDFGLDPPRGILLLGVQGCGKSLCAKVVASAWRMPLVRMDPGVLYQKFIGESEARLREALAAGRVDGPRRVVDRRDREGVRLGQRRLGRRRAFAADVRHPAVVDARPPPQRLPDRHRQQPRAAPARADAQGPVR